MKRIASIVLSSVIIFLTFIVQGGAAEQKLPVINGKEVVAMVDDEPITSEEFGKALANITHGTMGEGEKAAAIDYREILNRLIDEKLFLKEARNIGIDRLPEVTGSIKENAKKTLAKMLVREELKDIEVDKEKAQKLFEDATREYKITAVVFEKEEDAKEMEDEIGSGLAFDDVVKKVVADGKALESVEGKYLKEKELWPEVSGALAKMEVGAITPAIKFDKGYVILKLEDIRYPEDPAVRERIMDSLARDQRETALDEYTKDLIKKYVTIDEKLLESIDYDTSVDKFNKLLGDTRIIARVKGDEPVTVKELSQAFQDKFYHGVEDWIKRKELNSKKQEMLEGILQKRVLVLEAKKQGIDKTDKYRERVDKYNKTIVFEQFLNRVVTSDIKLTDDELMAYYNEHKDSYTTPEMMRIDSLVFTTKEDAEAAIQTLRTGTEFKWLKENVSGQVSSDAKGILNFGGNVLSIKMLPPGVQKVLSGVSAGDFRLFADPDGYYYVLYAEQEFPASVRPYQEVREEILKDVFNRKVRESMKEWSDKLKEHYPVKVYLTKF